MTTFVQLTEGITLKSDEDLRVNPLAITHVLVVGNALEGVDLNALITRHTGNLARVRETAWDAVNEAIEDEAIAPVRWICASCSGVGIKEDAVTQRGGLNVCQACADDLDDRAAHPR
jgi:hypothetical protein